MERKGIMESAETKKLYNFVRGFGYEDLDLKREEVIKGCGITKKFQNNRNFCTTAKEHSPKQIPKRLGRTN